MPIPGIDSSQPVLDAVVRLHIARARACATGTAAVKRFPDGGDQLREWFAHYLDETVAREFAAVTHGCFPSMAQFLGHHEAMAKFVANGIRVVDVVDYALTAAGSSPEVLPFLAAGSHDVPYQVGYGPVQAAVIDRSVVVLPAPRDHGEPVGLTLGTGRAIVGAALRYVDVVRSTAVPATEAVEGDCGLSPRQHVVASMLTRDHDDQRIATELGISVRTVRYDVAQICRTLGVSTRFAAGAAYARLSRPPSRTERRLDGD